MKEALIFLCCIAAALVDNNLALKRIKRAVVQNAPLQNSSQISQDFVQLEMNANQDGTEKLDGTDRLIMNSDMDDKTKSGLNKNAMITSEIGDKNLEPGLKEGANTHLLSILNLKNKKEAHIIKNKQNTPQQQQQKLTSNNLALVDLPTTSITSEIQQLKPQLSIEENNGNGAELMALDGEMPAEHEMPVKDFESSNMHDDNSRIMLHNIKQPKLTKLTGKGSSGGNNNNYKNLLSQARVNHNNNNMNRNNFSPNLKNSANKNVGSYNNNNKNNGVNRNNFTPNNKNGENNVGYNSNAGNTNNAANNNNDDYMNNVGNTNNVGNNNNGGNNNAGGNNGENKSNAEYNHNVGNKNNAGNLDYNNNAGSQKNNDYTNNNNNVGNKNNVEYNNNIPNKNNNAGSNKIVETNKNSAGGNDNVAYNNNNLGNKNNIGNKNTAGNVNLNKANRIIVTNDMQSPNNVDIYPHLRNFITNDTFTSYPVKVIYSNENDENQNLNKYSNNNNDSNNNINRNFNENINHKQQPLKSFTFNNNNNDVNNNNHNNNNMRNNVKYVPALKKLEEEIDQKIPIIPQTGPWQGPGGEQLQMGVSGPIQPQARPKDKFSPVESVLKFANMLLYKVGLSDNNNKPYHAQGTQIFVNPGPPVASSGHLDGDDFDSIDYLYNSLDNGPTGGARSTVLSPSSISVPLMPPFVFQSQMAPNDPSLSFNFFENALDSLLANSAAVDDDSEDELELRCPVHRENNKDFKRNSSAIANPKDLIQVCSCRLFKKKRNP